MTKKTKNDNPKNEPTLEESGKETQEALLKHKKAISSEFFEGQIRDVFRKPKAFFTTASAFEEGVSLLIMLRDFTEDARSNFLEHKKSWIERHFPSGVGSTLHEQHGEDFNLVYVLMRSLVQSYDPILHAEMET